MIWVDIVIPGVVVISALFSLMRGFVREALSLVGWLAAFWVALTFSSSLAQQFLMSIGLPSVRMVVSFTLLFVVTLVLAAIVNRLAGQLVKRTGLTGTDRMIGMVFGIARGVVLVAAMVLMAGMTTLPQDPWWHESSLIGIFEQLAIWLQQNVAPDIAASLGYG